MQITITCHHIEITDSIRDYVNEKLARLKRHSDRVMDIHVILSVEKLIQKAEATVHVSGANLFAEDSQEDLYAAIDAMTDKLDRQLLKQKEKQQGH